MAAKFTAKYLDKLIEAATTDAYIESEQVSGFFSLIEDNLVVPFKTRVLGQLVTVTGIDITESDQIVAICTFGKTAQAIPVLDLPMSAPFPEGAEWVAAYRRWCGS
ncbi:hypothetical protein [Solemya velesiana gill symbiont]|uniref:Uncharacterized protein n=1 Tax=Solemya velesiana gill symbiont TaxID=1918948 RepID=A0A1T2KT94_9GAMM|nr:hypothetical protein [Solemya velesiana gill symbiont]OOZ36077.1 hypothetical protein BOW51_08940 [Solemya velesiana gill symbiont]